MERESRYDLRWSDPFRALRNGGWFGFALFLGSLIWLTHAVPELDVAWKLETKGVMTQGRVDRVWREIPPPKGRAGFMFDYSFVANGAYGGRASTSESEWISLHVGGPIAVWYLPDDPDSHTPYPRMAFWSGLFAVFGGLFLVSLGAFAVLGILWRFGQMIFLSKRGLRRTATVTGIRKSWRSNFLLQFWTVIWLDETGRAGASNQQIVWFHAVEPPAVGATITVYADPSGRLPTVWEGDCGARD